jgi:hypothetical protein
MIKALPIAAPLALLLAAPSQAAAPEAPEAVRQAFGNTIVSTYPDGRTGLLWLKPDGTYTGKGRRRLPSSGTWTVRGAKMCLRQLKPRKAPFNYCTALPSATTWTAKAVTGETVRVKVEKGIVESG